MFVGIFIKHTYRQQGECVGVCRVRHIVFDFVEVSCDLKMSSSHSQSTEWKQVKRSGGFRRKVDKYKNSLKNNKGVFEVRTHRGLHTKKARKV